LDLTALDPDFYIGNCHKWMLSPKGAGFLYTRKELQSLVEPLIVSWGWGQNSPYTTGSSYIDKLEWWGTNDPSTYLSVPAAIQFMDEQDWPAVQKGCRRILREAIQKISDLTGLDSFYTEDTHAFSQMAIAPLPPIKDLSSFQAQLYQQYKIEVPCISWNDRHFIRISIQGYNTASDVELLIRALAELLPQHSLTT